MQTHHFVYARADAVMHNSIDMLYEGLENSCVVKRT